MYGKNGFSGLWRPDYAAIVPVSDPPAAILEASRSVLPLQIDGSRFQY